MWRNILESLCVKTRNKWDCWESSAWSERRTICGTVGIRSGWRMVDGFYGMLLLSAIHSRCLVWCENTVRNRFGNSFNGPVIPSGAIVEYHPFVRKTFRDCINLAQKSFQANSLDMRYTRGENLERRRMDDRHWRIGADERIWTPRLKAQCKGSVNAAEKWQLHMPSRRWNSSSLWRRSASGNLHLIRDRPVRGEEQGVPQVPNQTSFVLQLHDKTPHRMMRMLKKTSGLWPEISYTVLTWNL